MLDEARAWTGNLADTVKSLGSDTKGSANTFQLEFDASAFSFLIAWCRLSHKPAVTAFI